MKTLSIVTEDNDFNPCYDKLRLIVKENGGFGMIAEIVTLLQKEGYSVYFGTVQSTKDVTTYRPAIYFDDDKEYLRFLLEYS